MKQGLVDRLTFGRRHAAPLQKWPPWPIPTFDNIVCTLQQSNYKTTRYENTTWTKNEVGIFTILAFLVQDCTNFICWGAIKFSGCGIFSSSKLGELGAASSRTAQSQIFSRKLVFFPWWNAPLNFLPLLYVASHFHYFWRTSFRSNV